MKHPRGLSQGHLNVSTFCPWISPDQTVVWGSSWSSSQSTKTLLDLNLETSSKKHQKTLTEQCSKASSLQISSISPLSSVFLDGFGHWIQSWRLWDPHPTPWWPAGASRSARSAPDPTAPPRRRRRLLPRARRAWRPAAAWGLRPWRQLAGRPATVPRPYMEKGRGMV